MEYNSQREHLRISDYGRNVVKLIDYAKTIEDRAQRTKVAEAIALCLSKDEAKFAEGAAIVKELTAKYPMYE